MAAICNQYLLTLKMLLILKTAMKMKLKNSEIEQI